jgi:uncharacterized membrane protein
MQHAKLNVATNKRDDLLHSLLESMTDEALTLKQQAQTHQLNTVIHCFPLPIVTAFRLWTFVDCCGSATIVGIGIDVVIVGMLACTKLGWISIVGGSWEANKQQHEREAESENQS